MLKIRPFLVLIHTNITSLKKFHFEPVYNCGRCKATNTSEVVPKNFLFKMLEVMEYASKKGIQVYYSGGRADSIFNHFCGAAGKNFCVTPGGDITSCYEVSTKKDHRSEIFFYGFIKEGKVHILEDKRKNLISRRIDNLEHCSDCFAKFNCAGDCLAKVLSSSGNMFDTSKNNRCLINRGILLNNLNLSLNQGELNEKQ